MVVWEAAWEASAGTLSAVEKANESARMVGPSVHTILGRAAEEE